MRDRVAGQLGEALDRTYDRRPGGLAIEPVEPKRVREEPRDPAGEAVELRQRVLTQRDQHVDPEGVASTVGSASAKEPGPLSSAW